MTLKASHIRLNDWPDTKRDELYLLESQLTQLDFYFLRYGPETGTNFISDFWANRPWKRFWQNYGWTLTFEIRTDSKSR